MVKKKVIKKKKANTKTAENVLIQNSTEMQKIMLKLIERFDRLSTKIEELLELFEDSAKVLVKKEMESGKSDNLSKELLEKINKLADQNRVIAKGLTLIHEDKEPSFSNREFIPQPNKPYLNVEKSEIIQSRNPVNQMKKPSVQEQDENPVFEMPK